MGKEKGKKKVTKTKKAKKLLLPKAERAEDELDGQFLNLIDLLAIGFSNNNKEEEAINKDKEEEAVNKNKEDEREGDSFNPFASSDKDEPPAHSLELMYINLYRDFYGPADNAILIDFSYDTIEYNTIFPLRSILIINGWDENDNDLKYLFDLIRNSISSVTNEAKNDVFDEYQTLKQASFTSLESFFMRY
ncbi:hypothetical protein B0H65DRAFT_446482 [Neurospora tetraspora]|uniref:Uncharacterized protein n=1 Tax=Neurospora tetraspora TaxID=94610 RepID=A0AAE0MKS4_9PEZI|nr:hypothetical protein B0H65DRAFT_446482 [Neurospora tetraspora]